MAILYTSVNSKAIFFQSSRFSAISRARLPILDARELSAINNSIVAISSDRQVVPDDPATLFLYDFSCVTHVAAKHGTPAARGS